MWVEFEPVRTVHTQGVLGDIESHIQITPSQDDKVQLAYDSIRLINATIRHQHNKNAAYFLDNSAFVVDGPTVTIEQITKAIPIELRGAQYNSLWHTDPLCILDELSANIVAMLAAFEYKDMVKTQARIDLAIEWLGYSAILYNVSHQKEIIEALLEANMQIRKTIKHVPAMEEVFDQFQSYLPLAARLY